MDYTEYCPSKCIRVLAFNSVTVWLTHGMGMELLQYSQLATETYSDVYRNSGSVQRIS